MQAAAEAARHEATALAGSSYHARKLWCPPQRSDAHPCAVAARRPAATPLRGRRDARAGARVGGDCVPRRRAHAAPTQAFGLKTAPYAPGTSTIKLDERPTGS